MTRTGAAILALGMFVLGPLNGAFGDDRVQPKIDAQEATKIIQAQFPNARIHEMELDSEDGRLVYEVELLTQEGQKKELHVDAMTGAISKVEDD